MSGRWKWKAEDRRSRSGWHVDESEPALCPYGARHGEEAQRIKTAKVAAGEISGKGVRGEQAGMEFSDGYFEVHGAFGDYLSRYCSHAPPECGAFGPCEAPPISEVKSIWSSTNDSQCPDPPATPSVGPEAKLSLPLIATTATRRHELLVQTLTQSSNTERSRAPPTAAQFGDPIEPP
ncbi:unnamed protein product [Phytophthora fragariaefolia]|uniref:Unnamed protein product n=1 Tax=Phytophthora fragariaefolia TaxID=1490495 RepID=A0A9W6XGX7_9STRA|nr:unnamed protein product [Phytophthora fragariaefolia]